MLLSLIAIGSDLCSLYLGIAPHATIKANSADRIAIFLVDVYSKYCFINDL